MSTSSSIAERAMVDGVVAEVCLTEDGRIRWRDCSGRRERCLDVESEVLGIEVEERRRIRIKAFVDGGEGWSVGCGKGGGGGVGKRVRSDFVVEFETENMAVAWAERIGACITSLGRPKRLFILLNPFGGKKCAKKIFDNEVKPLLAAAGVYYTLQETRYQLHAQELTYKLDLLKYDGIVCVSGDGVLVEVLNGLLQRGDWESAIKVPLGIIPAGTGNGMAKSLLDSVGDICSVPNAVFAIIRGHRHALDVATVSQGQTLFFSVLMLSWGLVADIDIESEKYRWMGSARFDIYPLLRIMKLRKYNGHVSFVPAPGYESLGHPIKLDNSTEFLDRNSEDNSAIKQCGYQGPKICFESSDWRAIEGPFVSVWLHNVPWANNDAMPAPDAQFSDGYYDLIIVKDCPKSSLLSLLLRLNDGTHVKSPYIVYLKVKSFRLEPGTCVGNSAKEGIVDSDGEVLARGRGTYQSNSQNDPMTYGPPIEMHVEKGLATVFSPR